MVGQINVYTTIVSHLTSDRHQGNTHRARMLHSSLLAGQVLFFDCSQHHVRVVELSHSIISSRDHTIPLYLFIRVTI